MHEKHAKPRGNRVATRVFISMTQLPAMNGGSLTSSRLGADASNLNGDVCVHACASEWASACAPDVFAIYDNNISPRLIMIMIKIIMLYFIQIRHTDDVPSTGTRLVVIILGVRSSHGIPCAIE